MISYAYRQYRRAAIPAAEPQPAPYDSGVVVMATKRELEGQLAVVAGFEDPQAALEQYPTPPTLAAHVVHLADLHDDIEGRTVLDLGTGTGMLTLGAALRGPARVVAVELDGGPLSTAVENRRRVGTTTPIHWLQADATRLPLSIPEPVTVVMNPPFGAQDGQTGADRGFLTTVGSVASVSYSVHNAGSEEFIEAFAADNGGEVTHAFSAAFDIDNQFDHHDDDRREIDTEVYRIEWDN
ncbi:MAG: putative RNA methylase [Halonotius sp. J07HN4]|jgi:methyltransferase (EC 2.1.1.-)|nr:MAG: putative RNA methylase [Halonotius sp. J07HN4]